LLIVGISANMRYTQREESNGSNVNVKIAVVSF